jgi:hypothetical protein
MCAVSRYLVRGGISCAFRGYTEYGCGARDQPEADGRQRFPDRGTVAVSLPGSRRDQRHKARS